MELAVEQRQCDVTLLKGSMGSLCTGAVIRSSDFNSIVLPSQSIIVLKWYLFSNFCTERFSVYQ